jgi:hypothetical protein
VKLLHELCENPALQTGQAFQRTHHIQTQVGEERISTKMLTTTEIIQLREERIKDIDQKLRKNKTLTTTETVTCLYFFLKESYVTCLYFFLKESYVPELSPCLD